MSNLFHMSSYLNYKNTKLQFHNTINTMIYLYTTIHELSLNYV